MTASNDTTARRWPIVGEAGQRRPAVVAVLLLVILEGLVALVWLA